MRLYKNKKIKIDNKEFLKLFYLNFEGEYVYKNRKNISFEIHNIDKKRFKKKIRNRVTVKRNNFRN